jgi:preprotein translocase subunit Sec61beta
MAQKTKGPGIQSAAGLIRYFDAEEDTNVKLPPVFVLVFGVVIGLGVILMRVFWEF